MSLSHDDAILIFQAMVRLPEPSDRVKVTDCGFSVDVDHPFLGQAFDHQRGRVGMEERALF